VETRVDASTEAGARPILSGGRRTLGSATHSETEGFTVQRTNGSNEWAREVGERQSLHRSVNERIGEAADQFQMVDNIPALCECGSPECSEQLMLTPAEYESLRRIPTHFAVLRGHDIPEVERVIEENDRFVVVEKFGESAVVAIKLDPRRLH
jgi:hypothetical protein